LKLAAVHALRRAASSVCDGTAKVIACMEDSVVIEKILTHLNENATSAKASPLPESQAPPHQ